MPVFTGLEAYLAGFFALQGFKLVKTLAHVVTPAFTIQADSVISSRILNPAAIGKPRAKQPKPYGSIWT